MLIIFWLLSASAFSSDSIAPGSIPIALSTPGTAGQSTMPNVADLYSGMGTLSMNPILGQSTQYTNTTPASSSNPWLQGLSLIPGEIASTAANLAKSLGSIPGYTPGGAPTVGGQFPYNYPITQTNITNNIMVQRTIYK